MDFLRRHRFSVYLTVFLAVAGGVTLFVNAMIGNLPEKMELWRSAVCGAVFGGVAVIFCKLMLEKPKAAEPAPAPAPPKAEAKK